LRIRWGVGLAFIVVCGAASACSPPAKPLDLLRAGQARREAQVGGRDAAWIQGQTGKSIRINDVVRATLNASPPSRYRFAVDIPRGARLSFACGIPPERHDKPGVEFVVKVVREGKEETIWTSLLDPLSRPAHRKWVPVDLDLSSQSGRGRELVFETRGFEKDDDARQAFWGDPGITVPDDGAPIAIVYLVDTLRADHTTPYGYARDTTPELMAFSKDAVVFDQAISAASWTKPAVASLMTSLLPGRHRAVQLRDSLDPGLVTLAEMVQAHGFATGAAVSNSVIYSAGTNFDQGFDFFAGLHGAGNRPSKVVEAGPVVDTGLGWLEERRGFPSFLYVHTMDPHVPYTPPPPFDQKYEPHPTPDHPGQDPRYDFKEPLDRDRLIAQYDGEIAYGDQEFGRFVQELKKRGLYDRALIVFMADHGEEFEDHGKWLHGRSVFDELIRIPLLVKFPGQRDGGRRVAAGADPRRPAHGPRALRAFRPPRPRDLGPSAAGGPQGRRPRAARGFGDQPSRIRGPRDAHAPGQVRPALQPGGGRALLRPPQGSEGAAEPDRPESRARAPAQGGSRSGDGPQPVPGHRALRGSGHLPDAVQDGRLDRGRRARRLRAG